MMRTPVQIVPGILQPEQISGTRRIQINRRNQQLIHAICKTGLHHCSYGRRMIHRRTGGTHNQIDILYIQTSLLQCLASSPFRQNDAILTLADP